MALSRDQILSARAKPSSVAVPEWGGDVLLRPLSVSALLDFMKAKDELDSVETFSLMVALSACDDDGAPLFTRDDVAALSAQSFDVVRRVGEAALKLNGMAEKADEAVADF